MAFLKVERKKSGTYLRILQSYRNDDGKPTSRVLYSLGKVEDYTPEQLRAIGIRIFELGGGELNGLLQGDIVELGRFNYGFQQIYGKALQYYGLPAIFNRIGRKAGLRFSLSDTVLLMLLERLQDPCSKLRNHQHQDEYLNLPAIQLQHLYRALDKLAAHTTLIQQQIFQAGRDLFNQKLDMVFYDVTTFYFESAVEKEGELRQKGFGKDGKIGKTQILFCMMIDRDKSSIGYRIFKGDTYEGHTFQCALEDLRKQYNIDKVIVVADSGMLSRNNLRLTVENGYEFIVGDRLKSLPHSVQVPLLDKRNYTQEWTIAEDNEKPVVIRYFTLRHEGRTIIATYSTHRAAKDKHEREHKLETAEKLLAQPANLKKKAARYYLKEEGGKQNNFVLDKEKIARSEAFDGFLAISTNNVEMTPVEVLEQYKQLYKIEHSFRTFKSHLETRPMFHWTDTRIEGHICLCYIAFALQNFVLQKAAKAQLKLSEDSLRKMLSRMQVSLIRNGGEETYLRSAPAAQEVALQLVMGAKPLMPLTKKERLELA